MIVLVIWNDLAGLFWYEAFAVLPDDGIWFDMFFPFNTSCSCKYNFRLLNKCQFDK